MLEEKDIVLGVTGGIAAYKAVEIARLLVKKGASVRVAMTEAATRFVAPLTFESVTGQPVVKDVFEPDPQGRIYHVSLGREADAILVAPATANSIAKIANGFADNVLTSIVLAAEKPVIIAPSMNCRMYRNQATQHNLDVLRERGYVVIEPAEGWLACGEEDVGRLQEPEEIVERVVEVLNKSSDLAGRRIVVTAGGTREPIDPVRFFGNRSSGLMGFEVAREVLKRGGEVTLVTGPSSLLPPQGADVVRVTTASEMLEAVLNLFDDADVIVMTAAVTDYRPRERAERKIKKEERAKLAVELEPTPDILKELSIRKKDQVIIGFAAETENVVQNARKKVADKKLDLIVANDISREGVGFGSDKLDAVILTPDGAVLELGIVEKKEVARIIAERLARAVSKITT
ncbi:MAG: bifunctional phosphopantothenoylcysteine decarboxylase/phosphopantothenate--cysteine ligase CoaBC [Actinobacteria bacterium]|nr:bifunctional phosphopantothenoylcysteine decarboxylase/phosphopantothenate--cysteine ligase CoaBC [Actinomycetota bacterium]